MIKWGLMMSFVIKHSASKTHTQKFYQLLLPFSNIIRFDFTAAKNALHMVLFFYSLLFSVVDDNNECG